MPTFPASGSAGPLLDAALGYARAALGADRAVIWAWPSAAGEPQLAAQCGCAADQAAGAPSLAATVLETPEGRWSLEAFFVDGGGASCIRLSFSAPSEERIREGVRRLAETIRDELAAAAPPAG